MRQKILIFVMLTIPMCAVNVNIEPTTFLRECVTKQCPSVERDVFSDKVWFWVYFSFLTTGKLTTLLT